MRITAQERSGQFCGKSLNQIQPRAVVGGMRADGVIGSSGEVGFNPKIHGI